MSRLEISAVLDSFHAAAAAADEEAYFAMLAPDMVFLGTDPGERWAGEDFRAFVHGYFSNGQGWEYAPSGRSVSVSGDGDTAWFDETVDNAYYGPCRGTGVLERRDGVWRIAQYNLTVPIPNELTTQVLELIRGAGEDA
jgi:ketosteroid isomerase-like protein